MPAEGKFPSFREILHAVVKKDLAADTLSERQLIAETRRGLIGI